MKGDDTMAAQISKVSQALVIKVKSGTKNGKDVLKSMTFQKVKPGADAQTIFDVGTAIAALVEYPLNGIFTAETSKVIES